mgnify:CR=1 FL=1
MELKYIAAFGVGLAWGLNYMRMETSMAFAFGAFVVSNDAYVMLALFAGYVIGSLLARRGVSAGAVAPTGRASA